MSFDYFYGPDKASVLLERLAKNWVNILLRRRIE